MKRKGLLVVVSGPAGVGKGTLCKAYMKKFDDMKLSVSNTTRLPRDGERDGVEYNFTTKENFLKMIENDELLEYVNVFENYYGTSKKWVQEQLDMGNDIILEIDIVGAMNVKKTYDNALLLFIIPPSYEVLEKRLRNRNTDSDDQIRQRLERMEEEIKIMKDYDYFVVNDDIDESLDMMKAIIDTQRCSVKRYGQQEIEYFLYSLIE
ncbi:MAG: guanylate kinase [Peptostreptococcaceae bacterium]|nr:guanylate kinase [Peptostreptococcaceae bacterium]